jgi:hypothetical protein
MAYGLTPVSLWLVTTEAIGSLEEILEEIPVEVLVARA